MAVAEKLQPVRLKISQRSRQVLIEPEDEDRYFTTVEDAVKACNAYQSDIRFERQFRSLLDVLGGWVKDNKKKLQKVFLTVQDAGLLFLVVTKGKTYDEDFESKLTDLDLSIANDTDYKDIFLNVQSLPNCSEDGYSSFLNPERILEYQLSAK